MGAVNISIVKSKVLRAEDIRVLSITTAPALSDDELGEYARQIKAFHEAGAQPRAIKPPSKRAEAKASRETMGRVHKGIRDLSAASAQRVLDVMGG